MIRKDPAHHFGVLLPFILDARIHAREDIPAVSVITGSDAEWMI
jgi:hypothetical protein